MIELPNQRKRGGRVNGIHCGQQARQRKETVQRVGFTVGVRYSATYGMQWWLSPYFFLLPGIRLISDMYESFMALLLSVMALNQRWG